METYSEAVQQVIKASRILGPLKSRIPAERRNEDSSSAQGRRHDLK